jgi:hypothetical protein
MGLMESSQLPLGSTLPRFTLVDTTSQRWVRSEDYAGRALLVAVICNHCPYVAHIKQGLAQLASKLAAKRIQTLAVSANDPRLSPIDSPEKMTLDARIYGYGFPYLFDADQTFCRDLRAACTPEFFLFDQWARLVYRGQMDDARPSNDLPVDGHDLLAAADALLVGAPPVDLQKPSMGCSIKWRPENLPVYLQAPERLGTPLMR